MYRWFVDCLFKIPQINSCIVSIKLFKINMFGDWITISYKISCQIVSIYVIKVYNFCNGMMACQEELDIMKFEIFWETLWIVCLKSTLSSYKTPTILFSNISGSTELSLNNMKCVSINVKHRKKDWGLISKFSQNHTLLLIFFPHLFIWILQKLCEQCKPTSRSCF